MSSMAELWAWLRGRFAPAAYTGGVPRSSRWPAVSKAFLRENPRCACCGRKADVAHHVVPFHVDPARELDPTNLMPACDPCHLTVCHLGDFRLTGRDVWEHAAEHLRRVRRAMADAKGVP